MVVLAKILTARSPLWQYLSITLILAMGLLLATYYRHVRRGRAIPPLIAGMVNAPHAPRAVFLQAIERAIVSGRDLPYSVILFDIDGFKVLNDQHGPEAADMMLAYVADKLSLWLPPNTRIARFGSDEFLAFLPNTAMDEALRVAQMILDTMVTQPFAAEHGLVPMTLSAGVASSPSTSQALRDVVGQATSALHEAKGRGRNAIMRAHSNSVGLCRLGTQIESALSDQRLRPAYQPIMNLRTGELMAEEGLARIISPDGHILGADQFMNAAMDLQLTSRIDGCLIEQTLDRCREQSRRGDKRLRFINVSAALLRERRLLQQIALAFMGCDVLGDLLGANNPLVVEITERELLREPKVALEALRPLLDIGVRLAIDDFGSGYSSFLYLTSLPIAFLKIEMELLQTARFSHRARSILKGIRAIASDLDILTVAEGVEDKELAEIALDLGMDWGQGFYFGRPALGEPGSL
ncbi:MAG: EAL domain-containing protein [Acidiferrobacter sp.]